MTGEPVRRREGVSVSGLPRPLPECRRCRAPLPRAVWATRRTCSDCATTAELMAAAHTRAELQRVAEVTSRRVNTRIDQLAAKRATRVSRGSA